MFSRTARKSRSERNCSGFFLCRGIIKRCTPLGSKCTPHRPFVKWYRGVKRKRLHGDHFRTTVEPVIVKRYRKSLVNRGFCKKKLDTRFDTHCIKTGVQLWSKWRDSNPRPFGPEPNALPNCATPRKKWSQQPESNRRPTHYECVALPTVLCWHTHVPMNYSTAHYLCQCQISNIP